MMTKIWRCQFLENLLLSSIEVANTIHEKKKRNLHIILILGAVVSVEKFDNHVKKLHSDRDQLFETEYAVSRITKLNSFFLKSFVLL